MHRAVVALTFLPAFLHGATRAAEIPIEAVRLSDEVLVLRSGPMDNNAVVVATSAGLVVVDTDLSPGIAERLREVIEEQLGRSDYACVINTHHHVDHVGGNQAFPEAEIVGHESCAEGMRGIAATLPATVAYFLQSAGQIRSQLEPLDPESERARELAGKLATMETVARDFAERMRVTPPARTFADRLSLDMGDTTVELYRFGHAHEVSDTLVHVPEDGVLMVGDVYDAGFIPYFFQGRDWEADRWLEVLDEILDGDPDLAHVVPGHGALMSREDLVARRDYIRALWEGVPKDREAGLSLPETLARHPFSGFPAFAHLLASDEVQKVHRNNVRYLWNRDIKSVAYTLEEVLLASGEQAALEKLAGISSDESGFYSEELEFLDSARFLEGRGARLEAAALLRLAAGVYPDSAKIREALRGLESSE